MMSKSEISYTIPDTIVGGILTICCIFIYCVVLLGEKTWWVHVCCGGMSLLSMFLMLKNYVLDFTITFDEIGILVKERNRLNSKEKILSYKWINISSLSFSGLSTNHGCPTLTIWFKGGGFKDIEFRYCVYAEKISEYARFYSKRESIVLGNNKKRKKTGLYKKDW